MIDLHTHIIPGIDDGSSNIEESIQMLSIAYRSGVDHIVMTPHCYPGMYENYATDALVQLWEILCQKVRVERLPINLYKGMEIMATDHLADDLKNGRVWTINDSEYFLVEFEFDEYPGFCNKVLNECSQAGFKPLIAHPERYYFVQKDPAIVYQWYKSGYGIQINKGSLLSRFGHSEKRIADSLLRHHLVHCVASDAHNTSTRSPSMKKAVEYLESEYGKEYAYMLTCANPGRILNGRRLVGYEPLQYNKHSGRHSR